MRNTHSKLSLITSLFVILIAFTFFPLSTSAADVKSEETVAEVNGVKLFKSDFDREVAAVEERLQANGQSVPEGQRQMLNDSVLDRMIARELLYQESQKRGIKPDQSELESEFKTFKENFASEDEFKKSMENMNLTEEMVKENIRRGYTIKLFIDKEIVENISISEQEAKEFYEQNIDKFKTPAQVKASHILIMVDENADEKAKKEAREKIEAIKKELEGGADFAQLAEKESQCPSSERGKMVQPFEDVAFGMKEGEVSDIVETRFGFHIIKVTGKRDEFLMPFPEIRNRIEEYLQQEKIQEEIDSLLVKLKEKAEIKKIPQNS